MDILLIVAISLILVLFALIVYYVLVLRSDGRDRMFFNGSPAVVKDPGIWKGASNFSSYVNVADPKAMGIWIENSQFVDKSVVWFQKIITVNSDMEAKVYILVDNIADFYVNGIKVAENIAWMGGNTKVAIFSIFLKKGDNYITIKVYSPDITGIAIVRITDLNGGLLTRSDNTWTYKIVTDDPDLKKFDDKFKELVGP